MIDNCTKYIVKETALVNNCMTYVMMLYYLK